MTPRTLRVFLVALAAMAVVMASAIGLGFMLGMRPASLELQPAWRVDASGVQALKLFAAQGEQKSTLFLQDSTRIALLSAEGGQQLFEKRLETGSAATWGDVDGDGKNELVTLTPSASGVMLEAMRTSDFRRVAQTAVSWNERLERAVAVRFDASPRAGFVLRASSGALLALSASGEKRWSTSGPAGELVTLDTIGSGGQQLVLCASKSELRVVDGAGKTRWSRMSNAGVRRARSLEPTQRDSFVALGEEDGTLSVLAGADGSLLWSKDLGAPATELRLAELNGDPASLELIVGSKRGGVWAFSPRGTQLLAVTTKLGKVAEIASALAEPSGGEVLVIGGISGQMELIWGNGKHRSIAGTGNAVDRLLGGTPVSTPMLFAASGNTLTAHRLVPSEAPPWYTLAAAGVFGCVVIAFVAWLMARTEPPRPLHVGAEQMTIEAQQARKIMLREALNELKQLSGQLSPPDLLNRLRHLREQLADADRRLLELGASLKPQTFSCNRCGGPLEIGAERCDYCGSGVVG